MKLEEIGDGELERIGDGDMDCVLRSRELSQRNNSTFTFEEHPRQYITQRAGGTCKCDKVEYDAIGLFVLPSFSSLGVALAERSHSRPVVICGHVPLDLGVLEYLLHVPQQERGDMGCAVDAPDLRRE